AQTSASSFSTVGAPPAAGLSIVCGAGLSLSRFLSSVDILSLLFPCRKNSCALELAISLLFRFEAPIAIVYPATQMLVVFLRVRKLLFQRIEFHDEVRVRREESHLT